MVQILENIDQELKNLAANIEANTRELENLRHETESSSKSQEARLNSLNSTLCSKLDNQAKFVAALAFNNAVKNCSSTPTEGTYTCGGTGGWRRVANLNMANPSTTCPSGWTLTSLSKRTCGRSTSGGRSCDPVTFQVSGGEYSKVCGRARGYQYGATLAFFAHVVYTIDEAYVTGLSITHGTPRQHIWTYAAGITEPQYQSGVSTCPCGTTNFNYWQSKVPSFVGSDYFCESGINRAWSYSTQFFPDDPLWDGENCVASSTCCSYNNPPYFVKALSEPTDDDIEVRLCNYHSAFGSDVPIELLELYVQ